MDSHCTLTFAVQRPKQLVLELDESMLVIVEGYAPQLMVGPTELLGDESATELSISGFDYCVVAGPQVDGRAADCTVYREGAISFVSER